LTLRQKGILCTTAILALLFTGCTLPSDALKVFTDQGLIPLQPARDYVKVCGLVSLPPHGTAAYLDPADVLPTNPNTYINFSAVIEDEARGQTAAIDVALSAVAHIIPFAAQLQAKTNTQVHLGQINASGVRLNTNEVPTLIGKQSTNQRIRDELRNHNRVFIVQEVYTAKTLSVTAASGQTLDISYQGTGKLPDCGNTAPNNGSDSPGNTPSDANTKSSNAASAATGKSSASASATNTPTVRGNGITDMATPVLSGISVGACLNRTYQLSLNSNSAIPIAVRLNEVELDKGELRIKYSGFKFPHSLGGETVEKMTAVIEPGGLQGLERRAR
jgi:hypothetical protein